MTHRRLFLVECIRFNWNFLVVMRQTVRVGQRSNHLLPRPYS
jgi:hypothetical protein